MTNLAILTSYLNQMTLRAFSWAGSKILMAADALLVGGINIIDYFRSLNLIFLMTIQTAFRITLIFRKFLVALFTGNQRFFCITGMVMAISAGQAIALL